MRSKPFLLVLAAALPLFAVIPSASAHAYLDASNPTHGATLPPDSSVLALRFTEAYDPTHTNVTLTNPEGTPLPTRLDAPPDRPYTLRVETPPLDPGTYQLSWTTFSIDSHVDHGTLQFHVGEATGDVGPAQAFDPDAQDPTLVGLETIGRTLFLLGALTAFGLPIYLSEVDPDDTVPSTVPPTLLTITLLGIAGTGLLFFVLTTRLDTNPAQAASTLPGLALAAKALLLLLVAAFALKARNVPESTRSRWTLFSIGPATLALIVHSMSGHGVLAAAADALAATHFAMTLHLMAAGLWAGGLLGLVLTVRDKAGLIQRIRAFTPLAIVSVLALAATGLVQSTVHLPTVSALWTSRFGQALIAKTLLFAVALVFGAWHGFALPARTQEPPSSDSTFSRSGPTEALVLAGVVLAAGLMGSLPVPDQGVDTQNLPDRVFEEARTLPNHDLRVRLLADPIRPDDPVPLRVQLRATGSVALEGATLDAHLQAPNGTVVPVNITNPEPLDRHETEHTWHASPLTFPQPGEWTLVLRLDLRTDNTTETIPIPVQPPPP